MARGVPAEAQPHSVPAGVMEVPVPLGGATKARVALGGFVEAHVPLGGAVGVRVVSHGVTEAPVPLGDGREE